MKQEILIKILLMTDDKSQIKAMKIACQFLGISAVKIQGDRNQMVVTGDGIDIVGLITTLRKKVAFAELVMIKKDEPPKDGNKLPDENKKSNLKGVEGERDDIFWNKKSDRNPKEAEIVQAEARDRYTELSTGNYGAKPESSSSYAKMNTDLLDRTFTNSGMDGITFEIKQSLDELKEKLDLIKIRSQLGIIIGCVLLLFLVLQQIAHMSTRLIGERGAIDRIAVNVPKMPKYIPAEGTENPRDRCTEFSTGNCGAKPESSSSDAKTNTDLLDRTFTDSRMHGKVKPPKIQVFINFRGVQLRNNFVGYLVDALRRSEINVFIDNHEQRGEDFNTLFKRIEDSGIAIVVFSSRYSESKWCLEELVKIKESVHQGLLKVLPIFYKVTPTNVKRLKGDFGDHFRDKEYTYQSDENMIKRWKEAIMFVSHKFAMTLDEKSSVLEIEFVETIVKEVLKMLQDISKVESGQSSRNLFCA